MYVECLNKFQKKKKKEKRTRTSDTDIIFHEKREIEKIVLERSDSSIRNKKNISIFYARSDNLLRPIC